MGFTFAVSDCSQVAPRAGDVKLDMGSGAFASTSVVETILEMQSSRVSSSGDASEDGFAHVNRALFTHA